jgi:protein phosphatase
MLKFGFKSDKGKVRENNQDAFFIMPEEGIFLIADGVGGHTCGELASRTAMTDIAAFVRDNPIPEESETRLKKEYFSKLALMVNEHIYAMADEHESKGMATTLIILYIISGLAHVLNVGDSRLYHIRDGRMRQVTEDHTFVNDLVRKGIISRSEAENHPDRNMITKAIGADRTVEPDFYSFEIMENDVILMCTDGLYTEVSSDDILEMVQKEEDMRQLCVNLVDMANNNGGGDNITVVSVKI